jgi:hypothetical protein
MANDIEITVRVSNQSQAGLAGVNQTLNQLRTRATAAGTALRTLEQRVDGAASALRTLNLVAQRTTASFAHLQAETRDLAQAMGQVATRSRRASDGFLVLDAEARILRHDMDDLGGSLDGVHGGMRDLGDSSRNARRGLDDLNSPLAEVENNADGAASAIGKGGGGGGLGLGTALGVAAAAALSAAPAMGAFVPMLAGVAIAAKTVSLGFNGIGKALKDQGTDAKKYQADLKAMSPASREMTRTLVDLKKEFAGTGKEIQKAMLPGFVSALKAARPEIKAVRGAMVDMSKGFGDAAKGVSKLMKDSGFQKDFSRVLKMGTGFIGDMTSALGPAVKSLVHFGAVSKTSLDAFSGGFSELMRVGVPGFFKGLEPGIDGASKLMTGLLDGVNLIVPALGRLAGSLGKNLGPLFGAIFENAGKLISAFADGLTPALDALEPTANSAADALNMIGKYIDPLAKGFGTVLAGAVKVMAPVFKNLFDLASIAVPIFVDLASAIGGPLLSAFSDVTGAGKGLDNFGGGLKDFGNWVSDNRAAIDKGIRSIAVATLDVVIAVVQAAPTIFNAFRTMTEGVMDALGVMVNVAAISFGWIPGVGDKLRNAAGGFNAFRASVGSSLDNAGKSVQQFSDDALPKLKGQRMNLDVSPFNAAVGAAGKALRGMPKPKTAKLVAQDRVTTAVRAAQAAVNALVGKTVVVNYVGKYSGFAGGALGKHAAGGVVGAYASGGAVGGSSALSLVGEQGPELVRLPVGSTVYPAGQSKRMMDNGEPYQAYASGGTVTKAEKQARAGARGDFGISFFGQMAGYQRTGFEKSLGAASTLGDLVSSLNKWRSIIKAATSGATERGLLRSLSSTGSALIRQEKALTKVNSALDKAKDKLSSLKDAASQLASGIKSGIVSSGSIVNGVQNTGAWTGGQGLIQQMGSKVADAQSLASALAQLKKRGLNAQSLSEIAQAGVEGGGLETAQRLLGSSKADITQINTLEKQLTKAAGAAGKVTADAMYAKQIKATDHLVDSLKKQQEHLSKSMDHLAKVMENAIKKGFGGKASGGIIGAASGGARGGLTWVGEQGPELARLPYGSTVYPAGQSRQMAMAGGGGQPIQVNLVLDNRVVARALIDPLRGEIKNISGGDVQKALGRGSG